MNNSPISLITILSLLHFSVYSILPLNIYCCTFRYQVIICTCGAAGAIGSLYDLQKEYPPLPGPQGTTSNPHIYRHGAHIYSIYMYVKSLQNDISRRECRIIKNYFVFSVPPGVDILSNAALYPSSLSTVAILFSKSYYLHQSPHYAWNNSTSTFAAASTCLSFDVVIVDEASQATEAEVCRPYITFHHTSILYLQHVLFSFLCTVEVIWFLSSCCCCYWCLCYGSFTFFWPIIPWLPPHLHPLFTPFHKDFDPFHILYLMLFNYFLLYIIP